MERLNVFEPHWPASELDYTYSHNPLKCGTVLFDLKLLLEEAAIKLDNHHQSILPMAYLYNACLQMGLLDVQFPELDQMINVRTKWLFGSTMPIGCSDAAKRLAIKHGLSPTIFAKNARPRRNQLTNLNSKMMDAHLLKMSPSGTLFRSVHRNESTSKAFAQLETAMQKSFKDNSTMDDDYDWTMSSLLHLTPLQFLGQIRHHIPQMQADMETIDYINLTRKCNDILIDVRDEIERTLRIQYPGKNPENGGRHFIPNAIGILMESGNVETMQDNLLRAKEERVMKSGPQLRIVAEVIAKFLRETPIKSNEAIEEESRKRNKLLALRRPPGQIKASASDNEVGVTKAEETLNDQDQDVDGASEEGGKGAGEAVANKRKKRKPRKKKKADSSVTYDHDLKPGGRCVACKEEALVKSRDTAWGCTSCGREFMLGPCPCCDKEAIVEAPSTGWSCARCHLKIFGDKLEEEATKHLLDAHGIEIPGPEEYLECPHCEAEFTGDNMEEEAAKHLWDVHGIDDPTGCE